MVEENEERLQRVGGRIGEQDLLSQNLVKEITELHQKIGIMETVNRGLSMRTEEIAERLEQTWVKQRQSRPNWDNEGRHGGNEANTDQE